MRIASLTVCSVRLNNRMLRCMQAHSHRYPHRTRCRYTHTHNYITDIHPNMHPQDTFLFIHIYSFIYLFIYLFLYSMHVGFVYLFIYFFIILFSLPSTHFIVLRSIHRFDWWPLPPILKQPIN